MKKLMITAAIVFAAIASQASCCAWQYKSTQSGLAGLDGATAYVILGSTQPTSFGALSEITSRSYNGADGYATTTKTKPSFSNSASGNIDSSALTSASPNLYLVLVNSDGTGYFMGNVLDATSYLYEAGGSKPGTLTYNTSSISWTSFGGSGDVPEPTSAMLLLLGVAGLALRRKQA